MSLNTYMKNKQISSQGATLLKAYHMSTMHWSINSTSHFLSLLDKHNLKQQWACTTCAHLIPITVNYMDTARRPHLFRIRLTFQDKDYKSQVTFKVVKDFFHLLVLYTSADTLFYNLNCYSTVATYLMWAF